MKFQAIVTVTPLFLGLEMFIFSCEMIILICNIAYRSCSAAYAGSVLNISQQCSKYQKSG